MSGFKYAQTKVFDKVYSFPCHTTSNKRMDLFLEVLRGFQIGLLLGIVYIRDPQNKA